MYNIVLYCEYNILYGLVKHISYIMLMIPLIYIGFISFMSSFTLSHFITNEYLRNSFEVESTESKKDSKVTFNKEIECRVIAHISNLSSNTIDQLWYSKKDYDKFKNNYITFKFHKIESFCL